MRRNIVRCRLGVALMLTLAMFAPIFLRSAHAAARIDVTGSLQAAINIAQPGDVLVLAPRVYAERITVKQPGTAEAPITIQGAGRGLSIIKGRITFNTAAAFWVVQDLDVDANGTSDDAIRLEAPTHHMTVRRTHLYHGTGYGVRLDSGTSDFLVEDSEIDHFDAGSNDAHGVGIMTATNVTVRRCDIHHNSGDAVQSNTPDYPGYNRFASNILVEDNRLHENRENAIDVKSTHGLVFRNNQVWGFHKVSTSDGMAIQVQYDAQDIQIVGNVVWDAAWGIEVTRGKKSGTYYPAVPQRVLIAGNLFHDLGSATATQLDTAATAASTVSAAAGHRTFLPIVASVRSTSGGGGGVSGSGDGFGIIVRSSKDVRVYNNTVLRAAQVGLYFGASRDGDNPTGIDIRDNVLHGNANDLGYGIDPTKVTGLMINYNHYVSGRVNNAALGTWTAKGYETHATSGDPGLDAGSLPRVGSQVLDSGANLGLPFTGRAPDRGWGEFNALP